jgi:hypothetical protein
MRMITDESAVFDHGRTHRVYIRKALCNSLCHWLIQPVLPVSKVYWLLDL